jgi:hypothetical protein
MRPNARELLRHVRDVERRFKAPALVGGED